MADNLADYSLSANDLRGTFSRSFTTQSDRTFTIRPQDTITPLPATELPKPEPDTTSFKGQLLLKLLEIESDRCSSKEDEEERTNSLAMILEGDDNILNRIQSGMSKYMSLLGIEESPRESIGPVVSRGANTTTLNAAETKLWDQITNSLSQVGVTRERIGSVSPINVTIGQDPERVMPVINIKLGFTW